MNPDAILFGAFERHNFGDLLMGVAFEKLLAQKGIRTIHASILENDLTPCGGTRVHSIFRLVTAGLDTNIPILHVGGETGSCTFNHALACDSPKPLPYHLKDIVSSEVHRELATDRPFPYLTPPREVIAGAAATWRTRLFSGIGLTRLDQDPAQCQRLRETLAGATLISFRDAHSLDNARRLGLEEARFAPDIVLGISRLIPVAKTVRPPYLLMHFNRDYLRSNAAALIESLAKIAPGFEGGLKIGLAGTANYHDSLELLYQFKRWAEESGLPIEVFPSVDIHTICQQIAGAAAVVSTSLHYRIVARSYGVPRLTMNVHKVNCWSESNDGSYPSGIEPQGLAAAVDTLMQAHGADDGSMQARDLSLIDAHLETIAAVIRSAAPEAERPRLRPATPSPGAPSTDLWMASMVRCLEDREASIRMQAEIIKGQGAVLNSKALLLRRLLHLLLTGLRRRKPSDSPSLGQPELPMQTSPHPPDGRPTPMAVN